MAIITELHRQPDVSFWADERRVRKGHGAENHSRPCRRARDPLNRDATLTAGVRAKRRTAGWDKHYLLRRLAS